MAIWNSKGPQKRMLMLRGFARGEDEIVPILLFRGRAGSRRRYFLLSSLILSAHNPCMFHSS